MSMVLIRYLSLLSTAPGGIEKLRGLIFELALRGKLVPQNPNDEPASELLKRITQERTQLVAEGKIKKPRPMPVVKADEQAFELPSTWSWVRFGSIAETRLGKMLDAAKNRGKLKPYLRNTNVQWWRFNLGDIKEMRLTDDELHEFRLSKGDLLICEGGEPGRCAIWRSELEEMYFQKALHRARPLGGCASEYLQIVLRQNAGSGVLSSYFTGATIKHFPGDKLNSYVLPLPPVAEQHRIVAKVEELMILCDRLEAEQGDAASAHIKLVDTLLGTLSQSSGTADFAANWRRFSEHFDTLVTTESSLDALKQFILQLAVMGKLVPQDSNDEPASELIKRIAHERARLEAGGICKKSKPLPPVELQDQFFVAPKGWAWCRLQNVFDVRDGTHDSPRFLADGIPFLTSKNIYGGKLDLNDFKLISESDHIEFSKRSKVDRDDILFGMIGSIGNPVIVDTDLEFSFKNMALFKYVSKALSSPRYLQIFLSVVAADMKAKAAGGVQSFVALGTIRSQPIALPPLAEQHRIVAKVDELMAVCDGLKADLVESRSRQERLASNLIETALDAA